MPPWIAHHVAPNRSEPPNLALNVTAAVDIAPETYLTVKMHMRVKDVGTFKNTSRRHVASMMYFNRLAAMAQHLQLNPAQPPQVIINRF